MTAAAARPLSEAPALPGAQRADLAAELLASIAPADARGEDEWVAAIERHHRICSCGARASIGFLTR